MADFATAIATVGQAIALLQQLRDAPPLDDASRKIKFAQCIGLVADVENALVDASAEARSYEREIDTLRRNFRTFTDTVEVLGYHYDKDEKGRPKGTAYCPVCIQKDGYMLLLTATQERGYPELQCPNCRAFYSGLSTFK
jgi:hypothetical protein